LLTYYYLQQNMFLFSTQYAGQLTPASTNIRQANVTAAATTATAIPVFDSAEQNTKIEPPVNSIRLTAEWCEDVNHRMMAVGVEIGQPGLFQLQISDKNARESMREVAVQQAKANARLVSAQAEADAVVIEARGRNSATEIDAQAAAKATTIKAGAEAEAIKTLAQAQQQAVESCQDPTAKQLLIIEKTGSFVGNNTSWVVPNLHDIADSFLKSR
jgi:regulator of protease activity HflC (stomatin/prohibitin superfamily)